MSRTRIGIGLALVLAALSAPVAGQNVVVEEMTTEVTCASMRSAECTRWLVATIMNEQGADYALFMTSLSKTDNLKAFSGQAVNAEGKVVRKFKKSDLVRTEYSEMLAVDAYMMVLDFTPPSYPVTITYQWTEQLNDDLIEFPPFAPQASYNVAVRHAAYRISTPDDFPCRCHTQNLVQQPRIAQEAGRQVISIEVDSLPPLLPEPYARSLRQRMPLAYFAPTTFSHYGHRGSLASWNEYGRWSCSLMEGRQTLTDATRKTVHQLTDGCATDREKVERLYEYLRQHTRYVSVQLGIGGHQPAPAADVARTGYGDCKALSNFMRALLAEAGIDAVYTEIGTRNQRLLPGFPSVGQLNHVILQVPLPGDTLWLECTNASLPLGYVHDGIAGHDALLITGDGGRLCTLPSYADSLNLQRTTADVNISADGSATLHIDQQSHLMQYENKASLLRMNADERRKAVQGMLRLAQSEIGRLDVGAGVQPILNLSADIRAPRYARVTGQRLFVPLCPLHRGFRPPAASDRRQEDLLIRSGYEDCDSITISIPQGYTAEALPKAVSLEQPFGRFSFVPSIDGQGHLRIDFRLLLRQGTYAKELFPAFASFMKQVEAAYGQRIVLVRNANEPSTNNPL